MTAFYNEIDPYAAQWLRNLIAAGHIANGVVDERSIVDLHPEELREFTQCHFFAGIGVWSHALRLAQWPDARPVWTGSCPCQPFSVAGAGAGVLDERHLWPHWFWLIEQCRPAVIFGEQVEAAIGHGWLDLVQADLEGIDYAVGHAGVPAAGVGAPHIRQRLWFVADSGRVAHPDTGQRIGSGGALRAGRAAADSSSSSTPGQLAHQGPQGCELEPGRPQQPAGQRGGAADALANTQPIHGREEQAAGDGRPQTDGPADQPGRRGGASFWDAADWIPCRDGKARPVEPGTFPLAHGATARVGRLRAYGNAIVPQVAAEVIAAFMECRP